MIAVTVVLAGILYIVVGHFINPDEEPPEDVIIINQGHTTQTDPTHWDTYYTIVHVNSNDIWYITEISFVTVAHNGSVISDASFAYEDSNADGRVTAGDSIRVSGMTEDYISATFKVLYRGSLIGQQTIGW